MIASPTTKLQHHLKTIFNILLAVSICLTITDIPPVNAAPPYIHLYVDRSDDGDINTGCLDELDTNTCQLRGAIDLVNEGAETEYYHIHLPVGTYSLTRPGADSNNSNGDLDVFNTSTVIEGAGIDRTVVTQADISERIFDHRGDKSLKLVNLTVSGGRLPSGLGAGIRSITTGTTLILENVKVTDNRVTGTADTDLGGGIYMFNTSLVVTGSIINSNRAVHGAGIYLLNDNDGPTATIKMSSIIDNIATDGNGGGIYVGENGRLALENVTIASNLADGDGMGGGIYLNDNLAADLNHVTVANNWASFMGDELAGEYSIRLQVNNSVFYYYLGNDVCYFPAGTSFIIGTNGRSITNQSSQNWCHFGPYPGVDPMLGNLGYYRSTVPVIPLLAGSPAIDEALTSEPPVNTDQRGKPRCDGDGDGTIEPDAGAYEICEEFFLPLIVKP